MMELFKPRQSLATIALAAVVTILFAHSALAQTVAPQAAKGGGVKLQNKVGPQTARAPYDPPEFWRRLQPLLVETDGHKARKLFEEAFQVKFPKPTHGNEVPDAYSYELRAPEQWFMTASIDIPGSNPRSTYRWMLALIWDENTFGSSIGQKNCLLESVVSKTLESMKWHGPAFDVRDRRLVTYWRESREVVGRVSTHSDRIRLNLSYGECVTSISFGSSL